MIIINLKGGLGNQMFQYAAGRALSIRHKLAFKLDKSGYERNHYRRCGLGFFSVVGEEATKEEIRKIKYPFGLLSKLKRGLTAKVLNQKHIGWEPKTLEKLDGQIKQGKDIYLDGYWQSYKYFEDFRDILVQDFSLQISLEQSQPELMTKLDGITSVSLSVRRTDYLEPQNLNTLGICSLSYYQKALAQLKEHVSNPHFFILSDDPVWVKENIDFGDSPVNYEANELLEDYQVLVFMSKCQHNIIANSSFSWWGAWLNQNPNKIVIAPDIWFTDGSIKINDIIPPTWNKVPR